MMLEVLLRASVDGAILVGIVWAIGRLLPWLSAATRTILWWCAAAKFVLGLAGIAPIPVPILPPPDRPAEIAAAAAEQPAPAVTARSTPSPGEPAREPGRALPRRHNMSFILVALWTAGALAAIAVGFRRWRQTIDVVRRSLAAPPDVQAMAADLASRLRLGSVPRVRMSDGVETPLVAGLIRPSVLLPANGFAALSDPHRRMALCHELAHIKRADLWLGCVPALAERVFFFHPLAHLAAREYALWREAACDAAVLEIVDAPPQDYGRLLIALGISRRQATLAAAGASWSFTNLKRRIAMLDNQATRSMRSRLVAAAAVGITVIAVAPLRIAARTSPDAASVESLEQPATTDLSPATLESRSVTVASNAGNDLAPREDWAAQKERELNYVMFLDDHRTTMSGSTSDIERARRFKRPGESLLWFRQDGREYIVRDPALLRQVEIIWMPVNRIGDEQGKVGGQQGAIGAKQGDIGARQAEIGTEQGLIGMRQGTLGARQSYLAAQEAYRARTGAGRDALEQERRELDAQMRELDKAMRALDEKMRDLDKPMRELDEQMRVLDKEMQALDREMREAARKAEAELRALLDRAIATGAAERM